MLTEEEAADLYREMTDSTRVLGGWTRDNARRANRVKPDVEGHPLAGLDWEKEPIRGFAIGHNSSTGAPHWVHRDSDSFAFRAAHKNSRRCCDVIAPSKNASSTFSQISSIAVLSLGFSHKGCVRPTETLREAFSACAAASCAFIPWTGHSSQSSWGKTLQ